MPQPELAEMAQYWANEAFVWVGFGTIAGLLAKGLMPGRDPGGAVATLGIGIGGAIVGCGILSFFVPDYRVSPLTPVGFLVATGGAFVLLFFYRLLSGYVIREDGEGYVPRPMFARRRDSRRRESYYDDRV
ncbi:MAG TPA: GlsB/YeaQ/YmgE family stress response membrane protein [Pirellulales bacterium]|nr:GlsB/YeaQ/YmgE family stress response membrane protein [Pirellulales bacterium]